jgi:hypothetical protein
VKLIYTNDGAIGLHFNPQREVIWCNSQQEAIDVMWGEFGPRKQLSKEEIARDVAYAIDHMAKTGDTIAYFGVLGSFMYTTAEHKL